MHARWPPHAQSGFTLVEILVAISILLVGVLGVVSLVDGANAVTSKTKAREGGTNIARSVIEVARSARYRDLDTASLTAALQARPGLADDSGAGYTITGRGVKYTVALTVCSLDDPKDNLGDHSGPVPFCADSDAVGAGQTARDRNPDDYKRVRITLTWKTRATGQSITQTSSIINPVGGLGPSVSSLDLTTPSSNATPREINSDVLSARFTVKTSSAAADVLWSVSGESQGTASGSGVDWSFDWKLASAGGVIHYVDCTYVLQADAVDETGRSGSPKALTVKLNRIKPIAPSDFEGGRNENANRVDVQWTGNPECDVEHYKVYRGTTPSNVTTPVTCSGAGSALLAKDAAECLDEGAPAGTLYYKVVALDRAPGGVLRDGAPSDLLAVPPAGGNQKPSAPGNVTACTGGAPGCNGPDGTPATSGVTVVRFDPATDSDGTIASYRIYRNGTSYSNRHGVFFSTEGATGLAWLEHDMPGGPHEYRVSAVDDKFAESDLSAPVSL